MSNFQDVLRADAVNAFAGADDFGEQITYHPASGSARTFYANVDRGSEPATDPGSPQPLAVVKVFVPYSTDATKGLSSTPDETGGRILVAVRQGGEASKRQFKILSSDPGGWLLRVM